MFLILILFRNPVVCLKAIGFGLICVFRFRTYYSYINTNREVINEGITYGLGLESERTVCPPYTASHVFARVELYKAGRQFALRGSCGRYIWRKAFGPVTPGTRELHELAAVTNKMTGYLSLRVLGILPPQEHIESILFFPRYIRCLFGLLFDALQGRTRGNEARVLLACLATGSLILNWLF